MKKPNTNPRVYRLGSMQCVAAIDFECMRIYAEYVEEKLKAYTRGSTRRRPVRWGGKEWASLTELAKEHNTVPQTLRYYIKNKKPFGDHLISYADEEQKAA